MRYALVAAAMLLTAACGAYQFPGGGTGPGSGTVSGRVISVPCSPIEPAQNACTGRPVAGVEISFSQGQTVERTTTSSQGAYSIDLAPGTYHVAFKSYMRVVSGPSSVTITAGDSVVADYTLDSGIRAPVPQQ